MLHALLPLVVLISSALAQNTNTTNSTNGTCRRDPNYDLSAPVNSSAISTILHSNTSTPEWYLTVTLNDTRLYRSADHRIWGFLSTPSNVTGEACAYLMRNLLPAQSGANGDCAGSLSDNCVDFLRRSMEFTSADAGAGKCPNMPSREGVEEACGNPLGQGWTGVTTGPIDIANSSCRTDRVPGPDQPPDGYTSRPLFGVSGFGNDESDRGDPSKFTWYERYATRPMPWVVAHHDNGESWTSVVCVTPRRVGRGRWNPSTSGADQTEGAWGKAIVLGAVAILGML